MNTRLRYQAGTLATAAGMVGAPAAAAHTPAVVVLIAVAAGLVIAGLRLPSGPWSVAAVIATFLAAAEEVVADTPYVAGVALAVGLLGVGYLVLLDADRAAERWVPLAVALGGAACISGIVLVLSATAPPVPGWAAVLGLAAVAITLVASSRPTGRAPGKSRVTQG